MQNYEFYFVFQGFLRKFEGFKNFILPLNFHEQTLQNLKCTLQLQEILVLVKLL